MKNTIIIIGSVVFIILIFWGCRKDADNLPAFSEVVDFSSSEELTKLGETNALGIYSGSFLLYDGNVHILSTTTKSLRKEARISIWFYEDLIEREFIDVGDIFLNGNCFKFGENGYTTAGLNSMDAIMEFVENEFVGKEITIKNTHEGEALFNETFYMPERIILNGIEENKIPQTAHIKMKRNDFVIRYNYDARNEKGLLVNYYYRGEYHGMTLGDFENIEPDLEITKAIHVKTESPNGMTTIPASFFEGVPDNGIMTLYVRRSNGKVIDLEGKKYFLRAGTDQQIRVVLE